MRYAAIDIGSNAVRLFIADVHELNGEFSFRKNTLVRVPIRLGDDVFLRGRISEQKAKDLVQAMAAFKQLMEVYKVEDYLAYATSAMRESENGPELVKKIKKAGINLQIVDGEEEAQVIYSNKVERKKDEKGTYLYIDVGGGSTELSIVSEQNIINSKSFKIGTIRLLENAVSENQWMEIKEWVKKNTSDYKGVFGIGTGGNIARLGTLAELKIGKPLTLAKLKSINKLLLSYSYQERIVYLGLRPDRADVIVPAAEIFIKIMKWAKMKNIYVPQVGVVDGIIQLLIDRNLKK